MTRILRWLSLGLIILSPSLFLSADSFPIVGGRVGPACPVIEIELTPLQSELIKNKYRSGMFIRLTVDQAKFLKSKAKLKIGPTKIKIYKASELEGSCTCALTNFGLPFKSGWLEIPLGYLCSDKESKSRELVD